MLEIQKFIMEHEDWADILTQPPYSLKIKENNNLVMFSYSQIDSDFMLPLVRECRGIILEKGTWKVVCHAFNKFGNYGEPYVPEIDWSTAVVTEKIDGSLIKVFWYDGWKVATNNSIDAFKVSVSDTIKETTFGDLFVEALARQDYTIEDLTLSKNFTYMFELVSPYTQIVVPYEQIECYYLGSRDNFYDYEIPFYEDWKPLKTPKTYSLKSLEAVQAAAAFLPYTREGYVVVDDCHNRCKIKSPEYVRRHYLATQHGNASVKTLFSIMQKQEEEEFLIYCPQYKETIENIHKVINDYEIYIENLTYLFEKGITTETTKKEFYEWVNKYNFDEYTKAYLLQWFSNQQLTFKDFSKNWSTSKWAEFYKRMKDEK